MLQEEDLDALYICGPPFAHGAPELAAIERGLPFFVEKPISVAYETAEEIAQKVQEADLITAVGTTGTTSISRNAHRSCW